MVGGVVVPNTKFPRFYSPSFEEQGRFLAASEMYWEIFTFRAVAPRLLVVAVVRVVVVAVAAVGVVGEHQVRRALADAGAAVALARADDARGLDVRKGAQ